jgi:hypothetical protein
MNSTFKLFLNSKKFSTKHKKYFDVYDEIFKDYINKPITFVEIGILNGGSLELWREYFGPHARIIGIDLNPECKKFEQNGIEIFIGDQSNPNFWDDFYNKVGSIDILLDDGGHTNLQQIITTVKSVGNIKDGGLLVTEDTHTSYRSEFNNPSKKSYINFSKKIIDDINFTHPGLGEFKHSLNKNIYSIRFFESFVVCYINRKKTYMNSIIENKSKNLATIDDLRNADSILERIKSKDSLYKNIKFLKKYKIINYLVKKLKKILFFFNHRKDLKKYEKYFK